MILTQTTADCGFIPTVVDPLDLVSEIQREAARCVACGLCVPRCPTYLKTLDEADSPRGRIVLAAALARGELPWSERLALHLHRCLACRACERACPAAVAYGRLHDLALAALETKGPRHGFLRRILRRQLLAMLADAKWIARLGALLRFYRRSGLQALARRSRLWARFGLEHLERALPELPRAAGALPPFVPARGRQRRGAVALFTGCVARFSDAPALEAAVRLLAGLGYDVHVPRAQVCCGALHQHSGELAAARVRMEANLRAFRGLPVEAVVSTASGCAAWLREYGQWMTGDEAKAFSEKVTDLSEFLERSRALEGVRLAPLPRRIAVHDPCTLANVLRAAEPVYRLLARIPQAEVVALPENRICCGGAGLYFLRQPEMAARLRADKLAAVAQVAPDILVTSNTGCALHLAAGLREAETNLEIVHPVVLIERQWRAALLE